MQRLDALGIGIGRLDRKIGGVKLNPEQFDAYAVTAGANTYAYLRELFDMDFFTNASKADQVTMVHNTLKSARKNGQQEMLLNDPVLMEKSMGEGYPGGVSPQ